MIVALLLLVIRQDETSNTLTVDPERSYVPVLVHNSTETFHLVVEHGTSL